LSLIDTDGNELDAYSIQNDHFKEMVDLFNDKIDEFEDALRIRCEFEGIPLQLIPANGIGGTVGHLYVLGREIYGIRVTPREISFTQMGIMQ